MRKPLTDSPSLISTPRAWTTPLRSTRAMRKREDDGIWKTAVPVVSPASVKLPSAPSWVQPDDGRSPFGAETIADNIVRRNSSTAALSSVPSITTTPETVAPFFVLITRPVKSSSTISNCTSSAFQLPFHSALINTAYFPGNRFSSLNSPRLLVTEPFDIDDL